MHDEDREAYVLGYNDALRDVQEAGKVVGRDEPIAAWKLAAAYLVNDIVQYLGEWR